MDGLIAILVIIGLISSISRKKKQRQQQQRARQAGYDEISAVPPTLMREDAPEIKKPAPEQVKIPYTREEWAEFLGAIEKKDARPAATKNADRRVEKAVPRSDNKTLIAEPEAGNASQRSKSPEGQKFQTLAAQRLQPEARHFEGESHKEHAAHRQRIAEEEAQLHREREELRELRNVNLKKLRSAVVMSEVLGKPVALRGRR